MRRLRSMCWLRWVHISDCTCQDEKTSRLTRRRAVIAVIDLRACRSAVRVQGWSVLLPAREVPVAVAARACELSVVDLGPQNCDEGGVGVGEQSLRSGARPQGRLPLRCLYYGDVLRCTVGRRRKVSHLGRQRAGRIILAVGEDYMFGIDCGPAGEGLEARRRQLVKRSSAWSNGEEGCGEDDIVQCRHATFGLLPPHRANLSYVSCPRNREIARAMEQRDWATATEI